MKKILLAILVSIILCEVGDSQESCPMTCATANGWQGWVTVYPGLQSNTYLCAGCVSCLGDFFFCAPIYQSPTFEERTYVPGVGWRPASSSGSCTDHSTGDCLFN